MTVTLLDKKDRFGGSVFINPALYAPGQALHLGSYFTYIYIQLTPDNLNLQRKLKKVRVIGSLKKITVRKEISKWMGERQLSNNESKQELTLNLNWSDKKVKTKNLLGCFEINSMFRTSVHGFFPTCHALIKCSSYRG